MLACIDSRFVYGGAVDKGGEHTQSSLARHLFPDRVCFTPASPLSNPKFANAARDLPEVPTSTGRAWIPIVASLVLE
jgi:hypothetical protein